MSAFEDRHGRAVVGTLAMFDRLIFRGHLRPFYATGGLRAFMSTQDVLLTGFGAWSRGCRSGCATTPRRWPPMRGARTSTWSGR